MSDEECKNDDVNELLDSVIDNSLLIPFGKINLK